MWGKCGMDRIGLAQETHGRAYGFALLSILLCSTLHAANVVGDPQIKTDDPYYPGELSCSTLSRLVNTALNTPGRPSTGDATKDQILKLWYWRLEHYFHIQSPEEYLVPGITPNPNAGSDNSLLISYDCLSQ